MVEAEQNMWNVRSLDDLIYLAEKCSIECESLVFSLELSDRKIFDLVESDKRCFPDGFAALGAYLSLPDYNSIYHLSSHKERLVTWTRYSVDCSEFVRAVKGRMHRGYIISVVARVAHGYFAMGWKLK